jgi:Immunity protein 35
MLSLNDARIIANDYLRRMERSSGADLVLMDEQTLEEEFGWVFFYNSKAYLETGDFRHSLAGNAPFIVEKSNGSLHVTGIAMPIGCYLEAFKKHRIPNPISSR